MQKEAESSEIVYLGTYPPRECGIATFTKDLTTAIHQRLPENINYQIFATNNNGVNTYNYPKKVTFQISDTEIDDYIKAAKIINESEKIKLVNIQHEFGLFRGEWGEYLLTFLELIKKPIIVTFHSVLPNPNEKLTKIVKGIAERASELVVMTKKGVEILRKTYGIKTPIEIIPHGIPNVSFENQDKAKRGLGYEGKTILSSFGLMSQDKGYEYVIEGLPKVIEKYPDLLYLIIGETHPNVRRETGEEYRNQLIEKIKSLGLEKNVKFYNKYVKLSEIIQYLKATDIYISPCINPRQITSGTLSYAMGCGRAIISTEFLHAKDIITPEKGKLVSFKDPKLFEEAITEMLSNTEERKEMEKKAYYYTRKMTWPNVAISYSKLFKKHMTLKDPILEKIPKLNTTHLNKITDSFGVIQFCQQKKPDINTGYTLDDNSRAMIVCTKHYERFREFKQLSLIKTYLDYIKYVQKKDGRIMNFVDKNKIISEDQWSEDAHGRALWSLGYLINSKSIPQDFKKEAEEIFLKAFPIVSEIKSPRTIAFAIKGLCFYNKDKKSEELKENTIKLADELINLFKKQSSQKWPWFEPYLTYSNSKLPEALLYAYIETKNKEYLKIGMHTLEFLIKKTFENNTFMPIGQRGWYKKGEERAYFDQQPIDVASTVETLILAYKITGKNRYRKLAITAFYWFLGKNSLNQIIYDEKTGGCHDGIGEQSINLNQGAESTISYLLAHLSLMDLNKNS
jgi:glycosyltransferase involved in cell wall biosynthesis